MADAILNFNQFMAVALANYTDPDNVPKEICEKLANTLRDPFYRGAQLVNLFESLAAVVLITVVIAGYGRKLVTHPNIKVLLGILYLACFLHAVVYSVSKIYQLRLSFFAIDPCHMFLPRWFYILTHTLIVFANCCMQNVQIVLIVERCVATVSVDTYETHSRALGAAGDYPFGGNVCRSCRRISDHCFENADDQQHASHQHNDEHLDGDVHRDICAVLLITSADRISLLLQLTSKEEEDADVSISDL